MPNNRFLTTAVAKYSNTLLLLQIFEQSLTERLKMTYRKEIYCQILLPTKSKMASVAILKFTLTAVTRSQLRICT